MRAKVFSPTNIALAKYWGKRDVALNLPSNGSISATLADHGSTTAIEFSEKEKSDTLNLNGKLESILPPKVATVLEEIRRISGTNLKARIESSNNFPTAAGLASSASGLSALTLAASTALKLDLPKSKLSEIARRGSGSACRSFFGGFAEWKRGEKVDGSDSIAEQLAPPTHWPLDTLIAVTRAEPKDTPSTDGMKRTKQTSPYFGAWTETAEAQLPEFRAAIEKRDFERLAAATEANCLRMHASAMAALPPVMYFSPITLEIIEKVWQWRRQGLACFFTIDAGPNVVVFCEPRDSTTLRTRLKEMDGVKVLSTKIGEGARVL